jgi:hypothetical protein
MPRKADTRPSSVSAPSTCRASDEPKAGPGTWSRCVVSPVDLGPSEASRLFVLPAIEGDVRRRTAAAPRRRRS